MPKTKLQVPFPEPKNLVEYGTIEGTTEERCQTADFLFFDDKVDAKKTDNNVVKVKGCLIHVDMWTSTTCPPSPAGQRPSDPNCRSWEKAIIQKIF